MFAWGVIGYGNIAKRFLKSLSNSKNGKIKAIATRNKLKQEEIKSLYSDVICYDSYDALIEDGKIDIIYIALPHKFHKGFSIKSLRKGIAVLCEKPSSLSYEDTKEIIACAKEHQVFYMEALKTRSLPIMEEIKKHLIDIGDIKSIYANFCDQYDEIPSDSYLVDKEQGGSINDVATYPLGFILDLVRSEAVKTNTTLLMENNIDIHTTSHIIFEDGIVGNIDVSMYCSMPKLAVIYGSKGFMEIANYHRPTSFAVYTDTRKQYDYPLEFDDMYSEIEEVHTCIKENKLESDYFTHQDSLHIISLMDEMRKQGIRTMLKR